MKLVTWMNGSGDAKLGSVIDGRVLDLSEAAQAFAGGAGWPGSMLSLVRGGEEALDSAREVEAKALTDGDEGWFESLKKTRLLAPLPVPESVRDAMAFEDHIINCIRTVGMGKLAVVDEMLEKWLGRKATVARFFNRAWYDRPVYYKSNRFSVVGPGSDVPIPSYCEAFDYELELGVVIGKGGTNIPSSEAENHIFGYTLFNDFSARDAQFKEIKARLGPAKGKDFNAGNAMGPVLVTRDEFSGDITMEARINGELWSRGSTSDMYWSFGEIIETISKDETLHPGEFIGSGTCSGKDGRGCGLEMDRFLKRGDTVELSAEGIGTLTNHVV